jgi:hypothetical protein
MKRRIEMKIAEVYEEIMIDLGKDQVASWEQLKEIGKEQAQKRYPDWKIEQLIPVGNSKVIVNLKRIPVGKRLDWKKFPENKPEINRLVIVTNGKGIGFAKYETALNGNAYMIGYEIHLDSTGYFLSRMGVPADWEKNIITHFAEIQLPKSD